MKLFNFLILIFLLVITLFFARAGLTDTAFDMLIFVSPQYASNAQVSEAIQKYVDAVKEDVGWDTEIISITPEINDFREFLGPSKVFDAGKLSLRNPVQLTGAPHRGSH